MSLSAREPGVSHEDEINGCFEAKTPRLAHITSEEEAETVSIESCMNEMCDDSVACAWTC